MVVIYPEIGEETQFVQNELLGFLENQWKYKACVPQRDHDIGAGMMCNACLDVSVLQTLSH